MACSVAQFARNRSTSDYDEQRFDPFANACPRTTVAKRRCVVSNEPPAQRQRTPTTQDKNAAWAETRAPWDANIDSTPYEFASAFELFAATNTKGRTWCVLFYEPANARARSGLGGTDGGRAVVAARPHGVKTEH